MLDNNNVVKRRSTLHIQNSKNHHHHHQQKPKRTHLKQTWKSCMHMIQMYRKTTIFGEYIIIKIIMYGVYLFRFIKICIIVWFSHYTMAVQTHYPSENALRKPHCYPCEHQKELTIHKENKITLGRSKLDSVLNNWPSWFLAKLPLHLIEKDNIFFRYFHFISFIFCMFC